MLLGHCSFEMLHLGTSSLLSARNYMFKVKNRNTRARFEQTIKTLEQRQGWRSDVFIVNFEHISNLL